MSSLFEWSNNPVAHRPYQVSLWNPRGYWRRVNGVVRPFDLSGRAALRGHLLAFGILCEVISGTIGLSALWRGTIKLFCHLNQGIFFTRFYDELGR
jgi:hypothetical protein